jgi:hypothetical protein
MPYFYHVLMSKFVLILQVIDNHSFNIVIKAFKRCKDSYFWGDFLNINLHNNILYHFFFQSNYFFSFQKNNS